MASGTTLANAYVQILPTTKGIKKNLEAEMDGAGASSGSKFSGAFSKAAKFKAIGAAAGAAIGKSLMEGAQMEQARGGIETLFGAKGAQSIQEYADMAGKSVKEVSDEYNRLKSVENKMFQKADQAWRTAGISANEYMEQSTSFAASLLQSVGGDQKKAADAANNAIVDMADNANKMGTPLEDIQNAYQGFAKHNYTMLDNLKLGYQGTTTEMERLLADAEKISGQKYDLNNLSDVYEAIHVIQEDLHITGTTANEAASTLSGSFAAMKAAASNMMADLTLGRNIGPAMNDLVTSAVTFVGGNLIPAVGRIFKSLPDAIRTFMKDGLPQLTSMGSDMLDSFIKGSDGFVDAGIGLLKDIAKGIAKFMPKFVKNAPIIIGKLADVINKNAPKLLKAAGFIMLTLGKGIIKSIPVLIKNIPTIFKTFLKVWQALNWLNLGRLALNAVKKGMTAVIKTIGPYVKTAFTKIKNFMLAPIVGAGVALKGVIQNIKNRFSFGAIASKVRSAFNRVKEAITSPIRTAKETVSGIIDKIKGFFPIKIGNLIGKILKPKIPSIGITWKKAKKGIFSVSYPKIEWNAKAMNQPYMFSGATVFGAGETGDEVLYGRQSLMNDIAEAMRAGGGSGGTLQLVINLDGKTIGQTVVDYQNGQTIMFGTNPVLV